MHKQSDELHYCISQIIDMAPQSIKSSVLLRVKQL